MPNLRAALVCCGAALGGCSYAIPSLVPDPEEVTGSITPSRHPRSLDPALGAEDLRRARGALSIALDPQGNGRSVRWDNPESGTKGIITPDGVPFVDADIVCRRFIATVVPVKGTTRGVRGTACRPDPDEWELKELKPWRKQG